MINILKSNLTYMVLNWQGLSANKNKIKKTKQANGYISNIYNMRIKMSRKRYRRQLFVDYSEIDVSKNM